VDTSYEVTFLYIGLLVYLILEVLNIVRNIEARKWGTTSGYVTEDDVNVEMNSLMVSTITYRYSVSGKEYTSQRIAYATLGSIFTVLKDSYIKSKELTVYYNPRNPSISVLIPGFRAFHFINLGVIAGATWLLNNLDIL
jgi:hypothetical protein